MKFAIIRERKNPPDRRAIFSPQGLAKTQRLFPEGSFLVESSPVRVFEDQQYRKLGFEVKDDISEADIFLGVKEVPIEALIPDKKYFFFSHTIKKQEHNKALLRAILAHNIELYDHELIKSIEGHRLIGFGLYAGLVGTYNCIRALGLRDKIFDLPKAKTLHDLKAILQQLDHIQIPPVKIVMTGTGKVAGGIHEILNRLKIPEVNEDDFLSKTYDHAVYTDIHVMAYNKRKDGTEDSKHDFYEHPEDYQSDFFRFAAVADILITGHFWARDSPYLITRDEAKKPDFNISLVADISCDVDGPVAPTIRTSSLEDPIYGYNPQTEKEDDFRKPGVITVMAVDNLPAALPRDASRGFGDMFIEHVMPAFFNGDKDGILERACMTRNGKLTAPYKYLEDWVNSN